MLIVICLSGLTFWPQTQVRRCGMNKIFSIEEANALLPHLRGLLSKVQGEKLRMLQMKPVVEKALEGHTYDWGTPLGAEYVAILDAFHQAVRNIEELGILVKDFDVGLCDFPHKRDGKMVLLCWKLDEDEVSWWHDLDTGFAGRQPL